MGVSRRMAGLAAMAGLSACTTSGGSGSSSAPATIPLAGLERVMGKDARALESLFGEPDLDVREIGARKLQFASSICVLDAYLYPSGQGREPVVTYVDARKPSGDDFDRASCVAALSRRREAR